LLLAYYEPDGRLVYAGRAGTGIDTAELQRLWRRLQPLAIDKMPLDASPLEGTGFEPSVPRCARTADSAAVV
jgi:ATP-dependent DNA ligase